MKKLFTKIMMLAAAAVGVASCNESPIDEVVNGDDNSGAVLYVSELSSDTRVSFEDKDVDGVKLSWEEGDTFTLYDAEGSRVDDFTYSVIDDQIKFKSTELTTKLTSDAPYTAIYPQSTAETLDAAKAELDPSEQNGDEISDLDNSLYMLADFTYSPESKITFEHQMAIMTFRFKSDEIPYTLIFENGNDIYTVKYKSIKPIDGIYTSHIMINPCEAGSRELIFSLYGEEASGPYEIRKTASTKAYAAGLRYTASVSDYATTPSKLGTGTESDPYLISTAEELLLLSDIVNNGESFEGKFFKMTNSIHLDNDISFSPIGTVGGDEYLGYKYIPFKGTFDGANFTISKLNINAGDYSALFGYIKDATIKNLTVDGIVDGDDNTGGVVGYADFSIISNCHNDAVIYGNNNVGGVVGEAVGKYVINCSNATNIQGSGDNIGGVGGSVSVIINCYNTAKEVRVSNFDKNEHVGGVVGKATSKVLNCYNTSNVMGINYVGGVVGWCPNTAANCYNTGNVDGLSGIGGIAGCCGGGAGGLRSFITNCYSTASHSNATSENGGFGGIVGKNYTIALITNCRWANDTDNAATAAVGEKSDEMENTVAVSSEALKDPVFISILNKNAYNYNNPLEGNAPTNLACAWSVAEDGFPTLDFDTKPAFKEFSGGDGSSADPYIIMEINDLRELSRRVNAGESFEGKFFEMATTVDIRKEELTAIGTPSAPFEGTFNGANYTITNLKIDKADADYQALFGYVKNATIENLTVKGVVNGNEHCGGIVGSASASTFVKCTNMVQPNGFKYVGGVAGSASASTFIECTNDVWITLLPTKGSNYVGGIVGKATDNSIIDKCTNLNSTAGSDFNYAEFIGGIVGYSFDTTISNCRVTADMYTTAACKNIGGLAGYCNNGTIVNCYPDGDVTAKSSSNVGVIAGEIGPNATVINCVELADCEGQNNVGELVGLSYGSVINCYSIIGAWGATDGDPFGSDQGTSSGLEEIGVSDYKYESFFIKLNNNAYNYNTKNVSPAPKACAWSQGVEYLLDFETLPTYSQTTIAYNKPDDLYEIYTASGLVEFAQMANGYDIRVLNGKLMNDVDLKGSESNPWTPIGANNNEPRPFKGVFDGNNHTISGLYVGGGEKLDGVGLFKTVEGGTIKNLTVNGEVNSDRKYTAGIVGWAKEATIENCTNNAKVSGPNYVGGIVGYCDTEISVYSNITKCVNTGAIESKDSYAGGIAGNFYGTKISYNRVGKITMCANRGRVTAANNYAGGIAGCNGGYIGTSYNRGAVEGTSEVGGLVGCANKGGDQIESHIANSYTSADVTGTGSNIGLAIGLRKRECSIYGCYYDGSKSGDAIGQEEDNPSTPPYNFKAYESLTQLLTDLNNFDDPTWAADTNDGGFPILKFEK